MSREEYFIKLATSIKGVMPDCCKNISELDESKRFVEDLGFDSIAGLMLCSSIEEQFNVLVSDKKVSTFATIKDALDYIISQSEQ